MHLLQMLKKILVLIGSISIVVSCTAHHNRSGQLNPELLGTWTSDSGSCNLVLAKNINKKLLLQKFSSADVLLHNVELTVSPNSITTKFTAPGSKFSGYYVEGELIIDKYCHEPLHKISN